METYLTPILLRVESREVVLRGFVVSLLFFTLGPV